MKKYFTFFICFCIVVLFIFSCKKGPGQGGRATIKGKVWIKKYNANFTKQLFQYNSSNDDVFIIYGDEVTFGDHIKTNYDGVFEFPYVRKGSYKVYVYSTDSTLIDTSGTNPLNIVPPNIAYIKEVNISKNKETTDIGTLTIFKN